MEGSPSETGRLCRSSRLRAGLGFNTSPYGRKSVSEEQSQNYVGACWDPQHAVGQAGPRRSGCPSGRLQTKQETLCQTPVVGGDRAPLPEPVKSRDVRARHASVLRHFPEHAGSFRLFKRACELGPCGCAQTWPGGKVSRGGRHCRDIVVGWAARGAPGLAARVSHGPDQGQRGLRADSASFVFSVQSSGRRLCLLHRSKRSVPPVTVAQAICTCFLPFLF